jgi:hypothetical protein
MKHILLLPTNSIIIIALVAFFVFGSIFHNFQGNIGAQSTAAAFSVLFVIILTKVLVNQGQHLQKQSELEKKEAERKRKVFETRVELYQDCAKEIVKFLEKDKISWPDIRKVRDMALQLHLVAGAQVLEKHSVFATTALIHLQAAMDAARDGDSIAYQEGDGACQLTDYGRSEIWSAVGEFLNACRVDLDVSEDSANESSSIRFNELLKNFNSVDRSITTLKNAKEPLQGGINEWIKSKYPDRFLPDFINKIRKFLNDLEASDAGLDVKVTKTLISLRKRDAKSHKRDVVYFSQVKKDYYSLSIVPPEGDLLENIRDGLLEVGIEMEGRDVMFPTNYSTLQMKALQSAIQASSALLQ